jgi:protoporphyrinogen oxidase
MQDSKVIIVGAGPAGLTAAYELTKHSIYPLVLEKSSKVGGLARTEVYKGYRFDIGGHRFYTKVGEVNRLWHEMLGHDLLRVRRLSRIYYRGRFFNYPIDLVNTMANLGLRESALMVLSYVQSQLRPYPVEDTFEQWVCNRFGRRLYRAFFQSYTEKMWGIPCSMIQSD